MVTGLPGGETHRARCEGSSSQQLEHNLVPAPENHGAHFNVPLIHLEAVATVSLPPQLEESTIAAQNGFMLGSFQVVFWFEGTHLPGPAGLAHYSAVQP